MKRQLITSAALLLALTACGQGGGTPALEEQANDVSTEAPTPETLTPDTYEYELNGGTMTLKVPAAVEDDEVLSEMETLRQAMQAPEVKYIVGDADNRNGTDKLSPYQVSLYNKNGKEYLFDSASTYIGDNWSPDMSADYKYTYPDSSPMTEDQYDELNSQSIDLYNSQLNNGAPGSRETQVWIYKGSDFPDEFTNLTVTDGLNGSVIPTPA